LTEEDINFQRNIVDFIFNIITKGIPFIDNKRRLGIYQNQKFNSNKFSLIKIAIGSNGFIISSYEEENKSKFFKETSEIDQKLLEYFLELGKIKKGKEFVNEMDIMDVYLENKIGQKLKYSNYIKQRNKI